MGFTTYFEQFDRPFTQIPGISNCPLKDQRSQGLGLFSKIDNLKTDRTIRERPETLIL